MKHEQYVLDWTGNNYFWLSNCDHWNIRKMTWRNPPPFAPDPPKRGKKVTPEELAKSGSEDGNQAALFCWAADNVGKYPALKWLHAIPNGGSRHIAEATKLVAAGVRSGVWDIFLPLPIQSQWAMQCAGLYIEMKEEKRRNQKDGGLSKEQLEFGKYSREVGYYCSVCYTWEEARNILIQYLELKVK